MGLIECTATTKIRSEKVQLFVQPRYDVARPAHEIIKRGGSAALRADDQKGRKRRERLHDASVPLAGRVAAGARRLGKILTRTLLNLILRQSQRRFYC